MCARNSSCSISQYADIQDDLDCKPLGLDFGLSQSPKNDDIEITSLNDELKSIQDFVKSLSAGDKTSKDIITNSKQPVAEPRGNHTSVPDQDGDIIVDPLEFIAPKQAAYESQVNATFYS